MVSTAELGLRSWLLKKPESWGTKGTFVKGVRNEPPLSFVLSVDTGLWPKGLGAHLLLNSGSSHREYSWQQVMRMCSDFVLLPESV